MSRFSILLPHKKEANNDKALAIALSCIADNTRNQYELIIDSTTPADPYVVLNDMARRASGEYLFFSNSDLFMAKGWDIDLLEKASPDTIVNITLVEPGAIGVSDQNIWLSFGMTPDTFNRPAFEAWAEDQRILPPGDGFEYYSLINRQVFLDRGGFDLSRGPFPEPLDTYFRERWLNDGLKMCRAFSFGAHLQNWSNPEEQQKPVRYQ